MRNNIINQQIKIYIKLTIKKFNKLNVIYVNINRSHSKNVNNVINNLVGTFVKYVIFMKMIMKRKGSSIVINVNVA